MHRPLLLCSVLAGLVTSAIVLVSAPAQAALAPPSIFGAVPTSPGGSLTPQFFGTAAAGTTVKLYGNPACTGAVLGSGTTDAQAHWLISVAVAPGTTVDLYGTAEMGFNPSACSTSHAAYTALVPPDTTITHHPRAKVRTPGRKATVSFSFASTASPALFLCTVDGVLQTCAATEDFTVRRGSHTVTVAAFDSVTHAQDPTPATYAFTVKHVAPRHHR
jgi:hypothetical protein